MSNVSLQEVIEGIKSCYSAEDAAKLSITFEGGKVLFEDEVWYEITTADSSGGYTAWCSILDGEFTIYDGDKLDLSDRIPAIDDAIEARR